MTTLTNSFEGGTNGTTITPANSGGASGNAFDASTTGTGSTTAYDNTHAAHGTLAFDNATGSTSTTAYMEWAGSLTGSSITQVWYRAYLYYTANPTVQHRVVSVLNGSTVVGSVLVSTAGKLLVTNTAGGTVTTSTAAIPTNQWFRIEGYFLTSAGGTTGQTEIKLFSSSMDEVTADETDTSAATVSNSTAITRIRFGISAAAANVVAHWLDDLGASSTGYIGPAVTSVPGPVVITAPPLPAAPAAPPAPQVIMQAGAVTGGAVLSGSGTLTAAPVFSVTAALSGSGSLTASPVFAGTAAMSGAGTLTGAPVFAATASLAGTGTLSAAPIAPAGAALTGAGTLTAAPYFGTAAALSGTGTLTGAPVSAPAAALSGTGTLSAAPVLAGAAVLSGSGTLTATPQLIGTPSGAVLTAAQYPRPPPPPASRIIPAVQPQDFLAVVADMQPNSNTTAPPTVVAAQVTGLNPQPYCVLIPGDCTNHGDNTGFSGEYANLDSMYGGIKAILRPVPGNHDWGNVVGSGNLTAYDTYWGAQAHSGATPPHFYSFDTPAGWHVIALDSDEQWTGSLGNPSSTYSALAADLAANTGKPLIAFWHHPRFSDGTNTTDPGGTGDTTTVQDIWNLLRDYACDLVFTGHCHSYQRFPKLGKTGSADSLGIREFVVGTGGSGLFALTATQRSDVNSYQATAYDQLNSQWFGYLKLWLTPSTYSWQFVSQNAAGSQNPGAVLDSGGPVATNLSQGASQGAPGAALSGSGTLTASPAFAGTASLSGAGSLTASPVLAVTASLSGTGSLSAAPVLAGSAALSGAGTLTAAVTVITSAALSGTGTLGGAPALAGTAALAGTGALSAAPAFTSPAALSGTGALSAGAVLGTAASLTGAGSLAAAAALTDSAALSGTGTLTGLWALTGAVFPGAVTAADRLTMAVTAADRAAPSVAATDRPAGTAGTGDVAKGTAAGADLAAGSVIAADHD